LLPTTSLFAIFVFSFLVGAGAVVTPGPVSTAIVSQSPRQGWKAGPLVAAGHAMMEFVIVILIVLGLGAGLAHPNIQRLIATVGGGLLVWMGVMMLRAVLRGEMHLPGVDDRQNPLSSGQLVGLGMLATASNPFWYAWWVTVAASYLAQAQALNTAGVAAFYLGHVSADIAWDTTLSSVVGGGRRWMNDTIYRAIIVFCGAFFVYLGIVFLKQGVSFPLEKIQRISFGFAL
jgi:threonine/homoserine/homoserine lactone efflux protein